MIKLKKDQYSKFRGGHSRVLDVSCEDCGKHLFYYQKDGPGQMQRCYFDRILGRIELAVGKLLTCPNCEAYIGYGYIYPREKRPALRMFDLGVTTKKIALAKVKEE